MDSSDTNMDITSLSAVDPVITQVELDDFIKFIGSDKNPIVSQRDMAKIATERYCNPCSYLITVEKSYTLNMNVLNIFVSVLNTCKAVEVLEAAIYFMGSIMRNNVSKRMENILLISNHAILSVNDIFTTVPNPSIKQCCLLFVSLAVGGSESSCIPIVKDGQNPVFSYICQQIIQPPAALDFTKIAFCLQYISNISQHGNKRPNKVVRYRNLLIIDNEIEKHVLNVLKFYANTQLLGSSFKIMLFQIYSKSFVILRRLLPFCESSNITKMITQLADIITWFLNADITDNVLINQVIKCFARLCTIREEVLRSAQKFLSPVEAIIHILKSSNSNCAVKEACLLALNNSTSKFYFEISQLKIFENLEWFFDILNNATLNIELQVAMLAILRNVTVNGTYSVGSALNNIIDLVLGPILNYDSQSNEDICLHSLSILCNISHNDSTAQLICFIGKSIIFEKLLLIFDSKKSQILTKKAALFCFRNLIIDQESCATIKRIGVPKFLSLFLDGNETFRVECIQILRNLFLQSEDCLNFFYERDGFLAEVIECSCSLSSPSLQIAALDIIHHLIILNKNHFMNDLVNQGCLKSLMISLQEGNVNRSIASECFNYLSCFVETSKVSNDPWTRISEEWKIQDSLLKKQSKKITGKTKLNKSNIPNILSNSTPRKSKRV
jgi:hypothetical protein